MDEEERAAVAAVALAWPRVGWLKGTLYFLWPSGHIDLNDAPEMLCGARFPVPDMPPTCPECALLWYREVRGE